MNGMTTLDERILFIMSKYKPIQIPMIRSGMNIFATVRKKIKYIQIRTDVLSLRSETYGIQPEDRLFILELIAFCRRVWVATRRIAALQVPPPRLKSGFLGGTRL